MSSYNVRASDDESTEDKMYVLYTIISNSQMSKFIHCTKLSTSCSILSRIKLSCFLVFLFLPPPKQKHGWESNHKIQPLSCLHSSRKCSGRSQQLQGHFTGKIQLMVQQYKNYQQHKMHFRPEAELTGCGLLTLAGLSVPLTRQSGSGWFPCAKGKWLATSPLLYVSKRLLRTLETVWFLTTNSTTLLKNPKKR